MNKYVFRAVGVFPQTLFIKQFNGNTHSAKHYSSQLFRGGETSSSTVMTAVVIAIVHIPGQRKKHTH